MQREQRTFVRIRRLEEIGGGTSLRVHCPRQDRSIELSQCLDCKHRITLSLDLAEGQSTLQCRTLAREQTSAEPFRARASDAERVAVCEIMPARTALVGPDMDLESLAHVLIERGLNAVPVVDDHGTAIGVISKTDLLRFQETEPVTYEAPNEDLAPRFEADRGLHVEQRSTATVADAMTPIAITLPETATIARAAALMTFEQIEQLPITGVDQVVVGMISSADILRWLARRAGYVMGPV